MEFRNWEICHCSGDLMDCIYFSHLQLGFKFILIILIFDDFSWKGTKKGVIIHGERPSGILRREFENWPIITIFGGLPNLIVYNSFVYFGLEIATPNHPNFFHFSQNFPPATYFSFYDFEIFAGRRASLHINQEIRAPRRLPWWTFIAETSQYVIRPYQE